MDGLLDMRPPKRRPFLARTERMKIAIRQAHQLGPVWEPHCMPLRVPSTHAEALRAKRRRQRGFLIPPMLLYLLAGIALVAALGGLYALVDGRGYQRGKTETEAAWQAREAAQNAAYAVELKRLSENALAATQKGALDTARTVEKLTKENQIAQANRETDLLAIRSGGIVFRDPGNAAGCKASGSASGSVAADTVRDQPASGGGFSVQATEFLWREASRADEIVRQLQAAQALLVSDREVCGTP